MIEQNRAIHRLTALWALSESGLGGLMHAFKIPFTGFFLGGFAIVVVTLLARMSDKPFQTILRATLLVVLVKAAASPHSPPMAYIAVGFQGLCGGILFQLIPFYRLAAILFGCVALFESAVQKFLVATLIFGKQVWEALDTFVAAVLKDLSLFADFSFSMWLIGLYTGAYVVWGAALGWWSGGLQQRLLKRKDFLLLQFKNLQPVELASTTTVKRKHTKLWMGLIVLAFIVWVFVWEGSTSKALSAVLRTVAALALLFWIITPLFQWGIQRWVKRHQQRGQFVSVLEAIPELRNYVQPAFQLAKVEASGVKVYPLFVENLILLSLYA